MPSTSVPNAPATFGLATTVHDVPFQCSVSVEANTPESSPSPPAHTSPVPGAVTESSVLLVAGPFGPRPGGRRRCARTPGTGWTRPRPARSSPTRCPARTDRSGPDTENDLNSIDVGLVCDADREPFAVRPSAQVAGGPRDPWPMEAYRCRSRSVRAA